MSELRNRKSSQAGSESTVQPEDVKKPAAGGNLTIQKYLEMAAPYLQKGSELVDLAVPYAIKAQDYAIKAWAYIEPYDPEDLIPAFCGLIMCFFGGSYCTLIAAVEAYRMAGFEPTLEALRDLREDFVAVWEASKKDDKEDLDGDGVADVKQITPQQLFQRKLHLFMVTVDPMRVTRAIARINAGFMAVLATLKIQFAKAITLGNAIADALEPAAEMVLVPPLRFVLPEDYKRWAQPLVLYLVRSVSISIAWFLQRIISAFHSAIRGGTMCSRNIMHYLGKRKYIPEINHEDTYIDEIAGAVLALLGFVFQISFGFQLPFPLNILLFPFTMMEWFLTYMVASD